jgi:hypothetical protein
VLWKVGDPVSAMKLVREASEMPLDRVREAIGALPLIVAEGLSLEEARALAKSFADAGHDATCADR